MKRKCNDLGWAEMPHWAVGNVLLCAVDSIETRRLIWDATRDRVRLFIDGRMNAEVLRVLTVGDEPSRQHYPTTLFTAAEAHVGPCTARSTIYTANIAAGQFARWLGGLPVDADWPCVCGSQANSSERIQFRALRG